MRNSKIGVDWKLLLPSVILVVFGLTILFSINVFYFRSQLVIFLLSLVAFFFFSQIDYKMLRELDRPIYIVALGLLVLVLIIGFESHGAVRWVGLFGVGLQFSEILKPFLAIAFASFLTRHERTSKRSYISALLLVMPIVLLIFLQPDLGNALIYLIVAFLTLAIFGIPFSWFFITLAPVIILFPFLWGRLHGYQQQRLLTFLHPTADPLGASYNIIQAMIAVGSGKFSGKGLGEGTQSALKFLPENHTDFIFATFSERLGFMGGVIVLLLFLYLLYKIFTIFGRTKDAFGKVIVASIFSFFLVHYFVNIGMNLGLLPIVGVTLPFVSFGGSSLLSNFIFLGILSSISVSSRTNDVLEIH